MIWPFRRKSLYRPTLICNCPLENTGVKKVHSNLGRTLSELQEWRGRRFNKTECGIFRTMCPFITVGAKKKDKYRRKGTGRLCRLVERIYSIPCRASYFARGQFEEQDELIIFLKSSWCNSSYSLLRPGAQELNKVCPPNSSDDLATEYAEYGLCKGLPFEPGSLYMQILPRAGVDLTSL